MTRRALLTAVRGVALMGLLRRSGACVTRRPRLADLGVLENALTEPVEDRASQADAGRAGAQYALSVLHAYGARGAALDPDQAERWCRRALAARGSTPITTYIAGLHGKPGRVATIEYFALRTGRRPAMRIDQCAANLARGDDSQAGVDATARGPKTLARFRVLVGKGELETDPPRPPCFQAYLVQQGAATLAARARPRSARLELRASASYRLPAADPDRETHQLAVVVRRLGPLFGRAGEGGEPR